MLKLDSKKIFLGAFSPSVLGAIVAFAVAFGAGKLIDIPESLLGMIVLSVIFTTVFAAFHFLFIIKAADIEFLRTKILKRKPSDEQE